MNLLARLLLEISVDFSFFLSFSTVSRRMLLKQSGILARMDGVVLGSNSKGRVLSPETRTSVHKLVSIGSLRGHIMYEHSKHATSLD
jgi:hypothetical protein